MRHHVTSSLTILGAAGALACGDGTGPSASQPISVSFTTSATAGASLSRALDPSAAPAFSTTDAADVLVISKAQVVVARMELERVDAACTSEEAAGDDEHENEDDDCEELQLAPSIVDLPVGPGTTVVNAITVNIPEGTYSEIKAKVRALRSTTGRGRGSAAFLAAHPEFDGVDVRVEGTFNGEPFVYTGSVSANVEHHFSPPLVVGTTPLNVTVNVDLANWFRTRAGTLIDPRTATAGTATGALVENNIRRSFRAFRDHDRDGHDDDDHDGEGDH
jgi:hypothetical protein